ncbi:precorrin-6A/cobalt-precorrin-6A reductase [Halosquirtibacter laminarini]|uniref:Precorrin-6A/cobalt-precorrin-6A reductase n=1 Tax=Halosquirtibacter laminarini TaxID=3374600 RepID=A0AC61NGH7_9BACT|nr:precorrin-6A/cobalt-precorrin-6A reductase [Prolixibacteraceae bacterium]
MIWVFGGTTEGKKCIAILDQRNIPYIYSTKTKVIVSLGKNGSYSYGALDSAEMQNVFVKRGVTAVIDAAHPFAQILHENVFQVCEDLQVPLVRFERHFSQEKSSTVHYEENLDKIISNLEEESFKSIFVMTGVQNIPAYFDRGISGELHFRIIDCARSRRLAQEYGVDEDHLHFFPATMNVDEQLHLMSSLGIDSMVTKESGASGFFHDKVEVSERLQIPLYVWKRPKLPTYIYTVFSSDELDEILNNLIDEEESA